MESPACCSRCRPRESSAKGEETRRPRCREKFALARRLHAENLEHQPLPDRVDDSIFKNVRPRKSCTWISTGRCDCRDRAGDATGAGSQLRAGPALGCKKPETRMDLAICWETPFDPINEPPRPRRIDGSEGGRAPAIFALVQHTPPVSRTGCSGSDANHCQSEPRVRCKCSESSGRGGEEDGRSVVSRSPSSGSSEKKIEQRLGGSERAERKSARSRRSCDCLCKRLAGLNLSRVDGPKGSATRHKSCTACQKGAPARDDPRLIKSAVGVALGTRNPEGNRRKNGSPAGITVPRPRTPFARRSFCIDTLAPPFNIVNGCRDADYPEHWRLMSIYQQSYRDPAKRRHI